VTYHVDPTMIRPEGWKPRDTPPDYRIREHEPEERVNVTDYASRSSAVQVVQGT
jgi:hypothetical protein